MTLTFRVSAFFLSTLALVLAAFSLGIFLLARIYLLNQVEARLDSALATLAAAAETTQGGALNWAVLGDSGRVMDASSAADAARLRDLAAAEGGQDWKMKTRRLSAVPNTTLARQVATVAPAAEVVQRNRHLDILVGVQL